MKRRASRADWNKGPMKLSKESTKMLLDEELTAVKRKNSLKIDKKLSAVKLQIPEPVRSSSFRMRKAPSWLSSYVTNASQEKEVKKVEKPKLKMPRFPTLIPPSKQGKEESKKLPTKEESKELPKKEDSKELPKKEEFKKLPKQEEGTEPPPALLRKQSTLRLDPSSPPVSSVKFKKPVKTTPSMLRKLTKILSSSDDSDSKTSVETKEKKKKTPIARKETLSKSSTISKSSSSSSSSKPGKKSSITCVVSKKNIKEDTITNDSKVVEICDPSTISNYAPTFNSNSQIIPVGRSPLLPWANHKAAEQTIILNDQSQPNMLEVVICISTSGALREYLSALQDNIREMIWRLQSLVPNLRIGVMAHTQGGIHDDPTRGSFSAGDHNYNRTGGHSGTKWLDLGATLSQICAFVDSLESESTLYPDYVQDNLEMALWKLQRCMSWSSCSYRTVIMIGRGRPNRTTFYHQKEHWRGWIRSALELPPNIDIPVIDWELEAKLLAEMGIHVFTIQATAENNLNKAEEDEGTCFFRRVAELTQAQHVRITNASKLLEIMIGMFCACHGSDLLLEHRDAVRDENDGVLPTQLTEVFVGLQLHSKSNSLSSLPSMLRNLDLTSMRQRLNGFDSRVDRSMDFETSRVESSMELENIREEEGIESMLTRPVKTMKKIKSGRGNSIMNKSVNNDVGGKVNGYKGKVAKSQQRPKTSEVNNKRSVMKVKGGGVKKNNKVLDTKAKKMVTKAVKVVTKKGKASDRVKESSLNSRPGKDLGKRKIKLSEKARESTGLLGLKKGRVTKAHTRKTGVSPLKRETVKAVLKSQLHPTKERKNKTATSSPLVKRKAGDARKAIESKQEQNIRKRKPAVVNGPASKVNEKRQRIVVRGVNKGSNNKVSPLNRKKSLTKSTIKPTLSTRKSSVNKR